MEPLKENIDGSKVERHEFKHSIEWGYVALGVGLVAVAVVAYRLVRGRRNDRSGEVRSAGVVDVGKEQDSGERRCT